MSGVVYALTNPSFPNLVKIGKTNDLGNRLNQLYSTGVPSPFECLYAKEVSDPSYVEGKLHMALSSKRRSNKREFFEVDSNEVVCMFDLVSGKDITPDKERPEEPKWDSTLRVRLPDSGPELEGNSVVDLLNGAKARGVGCTKYSTIISRRKKGWTMEQAFGFDVPPNYTEVNGLLPKGYAYFPSYPTGDDNTKPIVLHSLKRIYISQRHFADEHGIPPDYVSDKLKAGWEADKIVTEYGNDDGT